MNLNLQNFEDFPKVIQFTIIVICCLVFYYLGYMFDISSLNKKLSTTQEQEQELKTELEALSKNISKLQDEVSASPSLTIKLKEWQGKLIKSSQLPDLLNDILKIGTANQLQFTLFNPGAEIKTGPYLKVPIKTIVAGNYIQIATFVSQIANMSSIVVIGDFTISNESSNLTTAPKSENETTVPLPKPLNAELTLEVYYLSEK